MFYITDAPFPSQARRYRRRPLTRGDERPRGLGMAIRVATWM
jgi:hypothetical protein